MMPILLPLLLLTLLPFAVMADNEPSIELQQAKVLPVHFAAKPVQVLQPELLQLVAADAQFELLAEGFGWSEGPVAEPGTGALLFSDVPANKVYRWHPSQGLQLYLSPSGATGLWPDDSLKQGANGLLFNQQQQLVLAQHGDRRLAVLTGFKDGKPQYQTLASQQAGATAKDQRRLNSPNDLVQHNDQSYYFTDPPYGLAQGDRSSAKDLTFNGIWRLTPDLQLQLLERSLSKPNGLAFSPDQRWLYVANSDPAAAKWWRFAVQADGSLATGELFADATSAVSSQPGLPDGLKVLPTGQILATGPGGIWVFSASGQQLGLLQLPVAAANLALSEDRQYLYITASSYLLRMALKPTTAIVPGGH